MSPAPAAHFVVRPSTKLLAVNYVIALAIIVAAPITRNRYPQWPALPYAIAILGVLVLLWTAAKHLGRRFTTLTIEGDRLRYEQGMLSKTTRSLNMLKVQDVRVTQSIKQRIVGVGSLSLETAGENGSLLMENIDNPQTVADHILAVARRLPQS